MGSIVSGLFGKGGSGTAGEAVARARELAPGARFNPYAVRTATGTTGYTGDGQFYSELSQPYQELLGTTLGGAQNLFGQFGQFDPNQRAAEIYGEQAALLQPAFEQQATALQSRLFGGGRLGLRLAGESQGLGAGSGMVQPDALGLGRQQQQTLAQVAAGARQQAFGEQAQLGQMAAQALQSGMGISGLEQSLMGMGLNAEQARAAAALGAAQMELQPYGMKAQIEQDQRGQNAGFFGGLLGSAAQGYGTYAGLAAAAGPAAMASDVRLKDNMNHVDTLPNGIKLYTWEWKEERNEPTFGVLAQEVRQVIPEAVVEHPDGYLMVDYSHPELKGVH